MADEVHKDQGPMPEGFNGTTDDRENGTTSAATAGNIASPPQQQQQQRLGPLVRLWGIGKDELPPLSATPNELRPFLAAIVSEAAPFIASATPPLNAKGLPGGAWEQTRGRDKTHRESEAGISRSRRDITSGELDDLEGNRGFALAGSGDVVGAVVDDEGDTSPRNVSTNNTLSQQEQKWKLPSLEVLRARRQRDRRPGGNGGGETWFCRQSVHENAPRRGTASWEEFDRFWRREHARSEMDMTPSVIGAHEAVRWDGVEGLEISVPSGSGVESWRDFALGVFEMRHKVGRPVLKDRTFPVLLMSCRRVISSEEGSGNAPVVQGTGTGGDEAERTVDLKKPQGAAEVAPTSESTSTAAGTSPTENSDAAGEEFLLVNIPVPDFGEDKRSKLASEASAQIAVYVSVERVRRMPGTNQIEWVMATASDAGGVLPMWVQTAAVPEKLWKDVPMFFSWVAKQRSGNA